MFAVFAVFVGMPWAVFAGIAKVKAASAGSARAGQEMRKSELEALIQDAVADATAPLQRRIETLEAIVTDEEPARAPNRLDPAVLADALEPLDQKEPAAVQRRTRE